MLKKNKHYQILDHAADLRIKAWAADLPELFIYLAQAMAAQQALAPLKSVVDPVPETIKINSPDLVSLLVDWLNEILALGSIKHKVYFNFEVINFSEKSITALAFGQSQKRKKIEIKAATYANLKIEKIGNLWQATVIFDV